MKSRRLENPNYWNRRNVTAPRQSKPFLMLSMDIIEGEALLSEIFESVSLESTQEVFEMVDRVRSYAL